MTELLRRGGIEFLAVFLGIALSLWVDQYQKSKPIGIIEPYSGVWKVFNDMTYRALNEESS